MIRMRYGWNTGSMLLIVLLCAALTACSGGNANEGSGALPVSSGSSDAPADSDGSAVVTMTVMTKDRFLTEAEQKFESANPGIDIRITELVPADTSSGDKVMKIAGEDSGPKPEDVEKYVNTVNTAIMSGHATDIIAVENLPMAKYAADGLLADWNEPAGRDDSFNKSDYYEKVFDGVAGGGAWYGIPTSFSLEVLLGDASLLKEGGLDEKTWTWAQFIDLLQTSKAGGKYGVAAITPAKLLGYLTESAYDQLVKREGSSVTFDTNAFQGYMEQIKKLYDGGLATTEKLGPENTNFRFLSMEMPMDIVMIPKMGGSDQTMLRPPGTGRDEGIPFKSDQVLSLNAQSQVKDAAWSFVKFLLSEEMQSAKSLMKYPVNKAALKSKLEETRQMLDGTGGSKGKIMMKGPDGKATQPKLSEEDIAEVVDLMPFVGKYGNRDPKVLSMIAEESAAYFSGSKSAEAVANLLGNRINTYLNE